MEDLTNAADLSGLLNQWLAICLYERLRKHRWNRVSAHPALLGDSRKSAICATVDFVKVWKALGADPLAWCEHPPPDIRDDVFGLADP